MNPSKPTRRFKINPVEIFIFAVAAFGLGFSVYNLFEEKDGFQFAALQAMSSKPTQAAHFDGKTARMPASGSTASPVSSDPNSLKKPAFPSSR